MVTREPAPIHLQEFLARPDADRASRNFRKLLRHDIHGLALTGGLAVEIHRVSRGCVPSLRAFNDIDFIAESFDSIPMTLADSLIFRHIHPLDLPGKTLLQCVDAESSVRIDIFRAYGGEARRTSIVDFTFGMIRLISFEDLVARCARLALDLANGVSTPAVHAIDFLRLVELAETTEVESVWPDHRKPGQPATFAEASYALNDMIPSRRHLLISRNYSRDIAAQCARCRDTSAFRLADPKIVLSLLGYC
jgi:hypothetical protein